MKKQILVGMLLSLTLFSCGDKTNDTSANATSSAVDKTALKTPEEYAAIECEYLTKEKAASKAGNKEERKKLDELGDQLRKEVKEAFKNDDSKRKAFTKLVRECRESLYPEERESLNMEDSTTKISE
jgi:hypothetical protein